MFFPFRVPFYQNYCINLLIPYVSCSAETICVIWCCADIYLKVPI